MPRYHTEVTADVSPFNKAMDEAAQKAVSDAQRIQSAWRESFYQMGQNAAGGLKQTQTAFDTIKEGIKGLRGVVAAAGGAIATGLFLKKLTDDSMKATIETEKLAIMLGINTLQASALKVALSDIGSDTDNYVGAVSRLTVGLRENEDRFNALGVKTRDQNGNLLSTEEIMRNAFSAAMKFKEGTDRNLVSTELFGKAWTEVQRLMKLTPAVMEEARQKAAALETTIGSEGVDRAERYRKAMDDVKDVISALGNRIAQALMPVLSDVGEWMAAAGPAAVTILRGAVGGLVAVWHGLANAVVIVWQIVKGFIFNTTEPLVGFGEAMALAISGNFAQAGARLRQITPNIKAAWENAWDEILKSSEDRSKKILALFDPEAEQGGARNPTGDRSYKPEIKGSRVSRWDAELAAQRDAFDRMMLEHGSFEQFSKQQESAYWKSILDTVTMNKEERVAVLKKYYDAERDIRKTAFEAEVAGIKAQLEYHKQGAAERITILNNIAAKMRERFGAESKEAKQAMAEVAQARREHAEREIRLFEIEIEANRNYHMQRVDLERANLELLETMGVINGRQKVARLRELKEIEFQIELQSAQAKAQLLINDVEAYRKAMEQIAALRAKHQVEMKQFDNREAEERKKLLDKWIDPFTDALQTMVNGMLQGTQRLSDIFRNAMRNLLAQGIVTLIKLGAEWVKTEILKTSATTAGAAARTTAEQGAAAASSGASIGTAITTIGAEAWEAAASVYASIAQIPYVGPVLAPAMAAAAAGMVLGFIGRIAKASGGFDVPSGTAPITQLHSEEMVLPAHIANPLRESLAGGGGPGGGATHVHFHGPVFDPRGMERFFRDNASLLRPALHKLAKNNQG